MGPKKKSKLSRRTKSTQSQWHVRRAAGRKGASEYHEDEDAENRDNLEDDPNANEPPSPNANEPPSLDEHVDFSVQVGAGFFLRNNKETQCSSYLNFEDPTLGESADCNCADFGVQIGAPYFSFSDEETQVSMHEGFGEPSTKVAVAVQNGPSLIHLIEKETQAGSGIIRDEEVKESELLLVTVGNNYYLIHKALLTSNDINLITSEIAPLLPLNWTVFARQETIVFNFMTLHDNNPKIVKSIVWNGSELSICIHGYFLRNNHNIWELWDLSSALCMNLLTVLTTVNNLHICSGSVLKECEEFWQKGVFADRGFIDSAFPPVHCYRSKSCALLVEDGLCDACRTEQNNMVRTRRKQMKRKSNESRDLSKINIKYLARPELAAALQEARKNGTKYRREIKFLRSKVDLLISEQGEDVPEAWSKDFVNINQANFDKMTDLQKLFWDQQMKAASLKNKASMKWHPMMIRMALHFQMLSPAATDFGRRSGFLTLPCKRTLYDYSHVIDPQEGCQTQILEDLSAQLNSKLEFEWEKYGVLMFDEINIRANLVYSKQSGKMIGYTNLTSLEAEFQSLAAELTGAKPKPSIAKKALVFMFRNITGNTPEKKIKSVVAIYSASDMSASELNTRVWDVIYHLEASGIPVLAVTCDGASTNRRFISMQVSADLEKDFVYCCVNLASPELRVLFFIIDKPHLHKTLRNCFANSYYHKKTRKLWNKEDISWRLIVDHYERHKREKFRKAVLKRAYVYLTSFSCMNVSFAAKILSKTLAAAIESDAQKALENKKGFMPYKEAVKFMRMCNDCFDCTNGYTPTSHIRFRNENLAPYSTVNDSRFNFLLEFLDYLQDWENNVIKRPGEFSKSERKQMMLSPQTVSGLKITVYSFISVIKFLIGEGAKEICGRRLCQDAIEQYFSTVRQRGGSSNNPDLDQVLKTRGSLHAQKQLALPSTRGNTKVEEENIAIDNTPVPKRKKSKKAN